MTAPVPDYLRAARACYDLAGFRRVWEAAEAHGYLTDDLRARLAPIGDALADAEMLAAPELSEAEAATVARFDAADPAPESYLVAGRKIELGGPDPFPQERRGDCPAVEKHYFCTRDRGHGGRHVAMAHVVVATWPPFAELPLLARGAR